MTIDHTSAETHTVPDGARLTTLDPDAGYVTTMNTYTVAPERAEEVLEYLVRSAVETVRYVPGFVSIGKPALKPAAPEPIVYWKLLTKPGQSPLDDRLFIASPFRKRNCACMFCLPECQIFSSMNP